MQEYTWNINLHFNRISFTYKTQNLEKYEEKKYIVHNIVNKNLEHFLPVIIFC